MGCYVLGVQEIDQAQVAVAGGKGAHLGELSRIEGLRVPAGFCVTTDAFQRITDATTRRLARWSAYRFPPGPSRGGPASSWTWGRPMSKRATSWSPPTRTPAGRRCSWPSRAW